MEKTNVIKISREFKDNVLGGLWLGREISIDDAADPIKAFEKANEELNEAYRRLNGGNGEQRASFNWEKISDAAYNDIRFNGGGISQPIPTIQVSKKEEALNNFIEAIQTSTTKKGVEIFRPLVERENNPLLTEVFENKLSQLK